MVNKIENVTIYFDYLCVAGVHQQQQQQQQNVR